MRFEDKIYLDYADLLSMCDDLVHRVSTFKPQLIVGITRGGLLPAVHLSHALDVPMQTISWQTRVESNKEINQSLHQQIQHQKRVVFVDDINDSGSTFEGISDAYKCSVDTVRMVSMVAKVDSRYPADASLVIDDQRWVVFPYEKR